MPSYLVAVAGGNLVYQSLGPRSGVWAEPTVIKAAAVRNYSDGSNLGLTLP